MGCFFYLVALIFPPAAAAMVCKPMGLGINVALWIMGWIPATIHAIWVFHTDSGQARFKKRYGKVQAMMGDDD